MESCRRSSILNQVFPKFRYVCQSNWQYSIITRLLCHKEIKWDNEGVTRFSIFLFVVTVTGFWRFFNPFYTTPTRACPSDFATHCADSNSGEPQIWWTIEFLNPGWLMNGVISILCAEEWITWILLLISLVATWKSTTFNHDKWTRWPIFYNDKEERMRKWKRILEKHW
jgi:hypothetical protein